MREIKFRGYSDATNGMVYGDLIKDGEGTTAYYKTHSYRISWKIQGGGSNSPVRNGTIGQFTELKDKNGADIYEGDLLKWDAKEYGAEFTETVEWNFDQLAMRKNDWPNFCEVIGNIHETK